MKPSFRLRVAAALAAASLTLMLFDGVARLAALHDDPGQAPRALNPTPSNRA